MTYLTRRYAGVFYVRFRITKFSGRAKLLRFSLHTTDKKRARLLLTEYLAWLVPMQTAHPLHLGELFSDILAQGRAMILKGPARTRDEVNRRARFVETAWAHREDWIASEPCPIRDHQAFEYNDEVRCTLVMLNEMLSEDMKRLEIKRTDISFKSLRGDTIQALAFDRGTGKVRAYLPEFMSDIYDADADVEFGLREGETSIYDMYIEANGAPRKIHSLRPVATAAVPPNNVATTVQRGRSHEPTSVSKINAEPQKRTGDRLSEAKLAFLQARRVANGDGRADEDAGLIINFMIDFIGDKHVADISSQDLRAFEVAMAETPDRLRIPRAHTGSLFDRYAYAKANGYGGLKMLSTIRVSNVWHRCLHQFFNWMKTKSIVDIKYKFDLVPKEASDSVKRDAWTKEELLKLFSLPLFTGCKSDKNFWTEGSCFVQNELYWAYLLIFLQACEIQK